MNSSSFEILLYKKFSSLVECAVTIFYEFIKEDFLNEKFDLVKKFEPLFAVLTNLKKEFDSEDGESTNFHKKVFEKMVNFMNQYALMQNTFDLEEGQSIGIFLAFVHLIDRALERHHVSLEYFKQKET